jgi:hypothetical protein
LPRTLRFHAIFTELPCGRRRPETIPQPLRFQPVLELQWDHLEHSMTGLESQREEIDRKTSRSICDAVGERLQQSLRLHLLGPSPQLERLIEELRQRER